MTQKFSHSGSVPPQGEGQDSPDANDPAKKVEPDKNASLGALTLWLDFAYKLAKLAAIVGISVVFLEVYGGSFRQMRASNDSVDRKMALLLEETSSPELQRNIEIIRACAHAMLDALPKTEAVSSPAGTRTERSVEARNAVPGKPAETRQAVPATVLVTAVHFAETLKRRVREECQRVVPEGS